MAGIGGRTLGVARAVVELDTTAIARDSAVVKRAGEEMAKAFDKVDRGAKRASSSMQRIGTTVRKLRGEIAGLSLAAAGIATIGLRMAANLENAHVVFKNMLGSVQEADRLMAKLRESAEAAALPYGDMVMAAQMLLPALEGNVGELDKYLGLVRRLAALNPAQGMQGAAFALREAMSSGGTDVISLVERFNILKTTFRESMASTGNDVAAAMDITLNKMGMTEEAAKDMAGTFTASLRLLADAANQLAGEAFTDMMKELTPVLKSGAEWLKQLRETNPELVKFGGYLVAAVAVLGPFVLLIERLATAFMVIKGAGVIGALGKFAGGPIGAAAITAMATPTVGTGVLNAVGEVTGDEEMKNFTKEKTKLTLADMWTEMRRAAREVAINVLTTAEQDSAGGRLRRQLVAEQPLFETASPYHTGGPRGTDWPSEAGRGAGVARKQPFVGPSARGMPDLGDDGTKVVTEWARAITDIEAQAARDRIDATENFERQRTETIRRFGVASAREAEDWARSQARAVQSFQRSIQDVRTGAARREQRANEDFGERVKEIREDHLVDLEKIERDFAERREDLVSGHRDRILKAASRLDAVAIQEEQRRFATQMQKLDRDEKKRTGASKKQADERVRDEEKAHQKRLERAREADQQRIDDMRDSFERQQQLAAEDREIRNQRRQEDHEAALQAQRDAHAQRMIDLDEQEALAKEKADTEMARELADLGIQNERMRLADEAGQRATLRRFEKWWEDMENVIAQEAAGAPAGPGEGAHAMDPNPTTMMPFAKGGPVAGTTRALLHSGEYVLNPSITESLRAMMGNFSQPDLVRAVAGGTQQAGNTNTSMRIAPGAIVVNEAQRPGMTAREIEGALIQVIGGMNV